VSGSSKVKRVRTAFGKAQRTYLSFTMEGWLQKPGRGGASAGINGPYPRIAASPQAVDPVPHGGMLVLTLAPVILNHVREPPGRRRSHLRDHGRIANEGLEQAPT